MSRFHIGIVYNLTGHSTGDIFIAIDTDDDESALTILTNTQAIELAEALANTANIAKHRHAIGWTIKES